MRPKSLLLIGLLCFGFACSNDRSGVGAITGELGPLLDGCSCTYDAEQTQVACGNGFTLWLPTPRRVNERTLVDVEIWDYPIEACGPYQGYGVAEMWMGATVYDPSADPDLMFPVRPVYMRRVFAPAQSLCQPTLPWCVSPDCKEWPDSAADELWVWCEGPLELAP